jgi:hypothetical protein
VHSICVKNKRRIGNIVLPGGLGQGQAFLQHRKYCFGHGFRSPGLQRSSFAEAQVVYKTLIRVPTFLPHGLQLVLVAVCWKKKKTISILVCCSDKDKSTTRMITAEVDASPPKIHIYKTPTSSKCKYLPIPEIICLKINCQIAGVRRPNWHKLWRKYVNYNLKKYITLLKRTCNIKSLQTVE